MRLRTLALLPLLALTLAARADTIDDLVLVGRGHTITFSLNSFLPVTGTIGSSEFQSDISAAATVDGVGGTYIDFIIDSIFSNTQLTGDNITFNRVAIFIPGLINNDTTGVSTPLVTDNGFHVGTTFLVPGTYTLYDMNSLPPPVPPVPLYTLSITPESSPSPVPEPSTLALLVTGCLALVCGLRSRLAYH